MRRMKTPADSQHTSRFTGRHMLAIMILFFGVIIAVNVTMAFVASSSWTGLVVKNSYVASQGYNKSLQLAREQKARGWHSRLEYVNGNMLVTLLDHDDSVIWPEKLSVYIGRPAFEQMDQNFNPEIGNKGLAVLPVDLPPGAWVVNIQAEINGNVYRREARIFVTSSGQVQIQ